MCMRNDLKRTNRLIAEEDLVTLDEFERLLQSTGFPVSYGEPEDDPGKDGVYLCYQVVQSNNFLQMDKSIIRL